MPDKPQSPDDRLQQEFDRQLAKGLVPLALTAPLLLGRHVRDWLRWRVVLPFLAVVLPWYGLCYWRNGWGFVHEFIVVQHFSRVTSGAFLYSS